MNKLVPFAIVEDLVSYANKGKCAEPYMVDALLAGDPHMLEGLRALRLHHWKGVLEFSKRIAHYEARIPGLVDRRQLERAREGLEHCKKTHSFQMKQVQLLNDFFPIGDDVAKDADNERVPKV